MGPRTFDESDHDDHRIRARLAPCNRHPFELGPIVQIDQRRTSNSWHIGIRGRHSLRQHRPPDSATWNAVRDRRRGVETCMANAYSVAQFFGWEWGRHKKPWEAPRFTLAWIVFLMIPLAIVLTGVNVMSLVEYAVLFSIIVLPLTYLPLLLLAKDKSYMRKYANRWLAKGLGWTYLRSHHGRGSRCHPALFAHIGRAVMKPDATDQACQPASGPAADRQGRPLVRRRRRCRVPGQRWQGKPESSRCWSAPAPTKLACRAGRSRSCARSPATA